MDVPLLASVAPYGRHGGRDTLVPMNSFRTVRHGWVALRVAALGTAAALLGGCAVGAAAPTGGEPAEASRPAAAASVDASPTPSAAPAEAGTGWGPSATEWDEAGRIVATMDTTAQAGQVIVATYPGPEPPTALVRDLGLAGVILLGDNVPDGADGVADLVASLVRLQEADPRPYPLVVAVDQEGGPIARVGLPATEFPPAMAHGAADDPALTRAAAAAAGRELRSIGFTMVFAPVADVTSGPADPTIGVRSPGDDPALVSRVVTAALDGYRDAGIVAVLKHFPGHGSVPADSHVELPVQQASPEALTQRDLVPFARAVQAGAPAVMVAHLDLRAVDPGVPATLSAPVVTGLLRDDLGFEGLVVTDSMLMAAVTDRYSPGAAAVAAIAAGADLLLMPPDPKVARDSLVAAVGAGRLAPARLAEAARRVVAVQLHQAAQLPALGLDVLGTARPQSAQVSAAAVTMLPGPAGCGVPLVSGSVRVSGGTEQDRSRFAAAAQRAGLTVGSGPTVVLLSRPTSTGTGDVVVALDAPYGLGSSQATLARVALFGRTDAAFDALLAVLTGRALPQGRLPVAVAGVDPGSAC